jgi:hypothetical protein
MWSLDYIQEPIKTQENIEAGQEKVPTVALPLEFMDRSKDVFSDHSESQKTETLTPDGEKQPSNTSDCESDTEFESNLPNSPSTISDHDKKDDQAEQVPDTVSGEVSDDYVFISKTEPVEKTKPRLKSGYAWTRILIFRNKLTMHTAYDRKDNSQPAAITAIAISKDNRTIYVGDARGRLFSWTVNENPGRQRADHWQKDDVVDACKTCNLKFTFSERKHHCRNCGGIYCNNCTRFETEIQNLQIQKPVRVCQTCYNIIKAEENQSMQLISNAN